MCSAWKVPKGQETAFFSCYFNILRGVQWGFWCRSAVPDLNGPVSNCWGQTIRGNPNFNWLTTLGLSIQPVKKIKEGKRLITSPNSVSWHGDCRPSWVQAWSRIPPTVKVSLSHVGRVPCYGWALSPASEMFIVVITKINLTSLLWVASWLYPVWSMIRVCWM